jgi:hypothetical protein
MENNIQVYDEIHYGNGEFDFIKDTSTRELLKRAHRAVSLCELWDWIRIYQPPPNRGFMLSIIPELNRLKLQMWKDSINDLHSGYSFDLIIRDMEYIAKNGYEKYKKIHIIKHSIFKYNCYI